MKKSLRVVVLSLLLVSLLALSASASVVAWGSRGSQVSLVQQKLKQYGYYDGAVDGVFGKETYNAVVWFQEKNGLKGRWRGGALHGGGAGHYAHGNRFRLHLPGKRGAHPGPAGQR